MTANVNLLFLSHSGYCMKATNSRDSKCGASMTTTMSSTFRVHSMSITGLGGLSASGGFPTSQALCQPCPSWLPRMTFKCWVNNDNLNRNYGNGLFRGNHLQTALLQVLPFYNSPRICPPFFGDAISWVWTTERWFVGILFFFWPASPEYRSQAFMKCKPRRRKRRRAPTKTFSPRWLARKPGIRTWSIYTHEHVKVWVLVDGVMGS